MDDRTRIRRDAEIDARVSDAEHAEADHAVLVLLLRLIKETDGGRMLTPLLWTINPAERLALSQAIDEVQGEGRKGDR